MKREDIRASARGVAGIAAVRAMLSTNPDDADVPVADRRARLAAFAAAAPPSPEPVREERVGGVRALRLIPDGACGRIVYLHGGAYVLGSADTHIRLGSTYARASGAELVSVNYRLAPEHPYPAAIDDAVAIWSALGDKVPTALLGDSAGGGLALALAVRLRDEGLLMPAALAVTSPWIDLTLTAESIDGRSNVEIMLSRRGLALDAHRYRGNIPANDRRVSPLFADLKGLPPTMIQVGSDEVLYDDSIALADRLGGAGVDVRLEVWHGMAHAWAAFGEAVPEAALSVTSLGRFIRERLDA